MIQTAMAAPRRSQRDARQDHFEYRVFGLNVRSEIRLSALIPTPIDIADVDIRLGAVSKYASVEPFGLYVDADGPILNIANVGRFLIANGSEIIVEPHAQASARNVELYLLGSAFGAILHHRHLLPLHANAIEINGRAVAFMGHSGAGKSTLAAWFADHGYRILSDDVCVVDFDSAGIAYARAGIPRLRLWKDALNVKGISETGLARSFDGQDKFDMPIIGSASQNSVKLEAIYVLGKDSEAYGQSMIEPICGMAAVEAISVNTYRGGFIPLIGDRIAHMKSCINLAALVKVSRFNRHWDHKNFDEDVRLFLESECPR